MRHIGAVLGMAGLMAMGPAVSAAAGLCASDEIELASCQTGAKVAALCASPDLGPQQGTAQYRYGVPGKLELVFPQPAAHPQHFVLAGSVMFAGGGESFLKVSNGDYRYTFYDGEGKGWHQHGLLVMKGERRLANLRCKAPGGDQYAALPDGVLPQATQEESNLWLDERPDPDPNP